MSDNTVIVTPEMGLTVPTLGTSGPAFAADVSNSLITVDGHNHSAGSGSPVNLSGQPCDGDLSLQDNNLSNTKSVEFINQPSTLTGSQDVNCIYVNQQQLGFNNFNGIFIPITNGNTLAITALSLTNFSSRNISASSTILSTDTYNLINVNSQSGPVVITLPIAASITPNAANRLYIVRDVGSFAGTNNITIQVTVGSGNTFGDSGQTSFILNSNGGYVGVYTDGVATWWTFTQNVYNDEMVQFNAGSLLGLDSSTINMTDSCVFHFDAGTVIINNASSTFSAGSLTISNVTTEFDTGTTTFASSAPLVLNNTISGASDFKGTMHVVGSGVISSHEAGGIIAATADGITSGVAGGIGAGVAGGIVSDVTGGFQLDGGASDWVTFSSARTRTIFVPFLVSGAITGAPTGGPGSTAGWATAIEGDGYMLYSVDTSGGPQTFHIPELHQGANLASITILFWVNGPVSATFGSGSTPRASVWRMNYAGGGSVNTKQFLSATDPQLCPIPGSTSDWSNGGNIQSFTYTTDQHATIDRSQFAYYIQLIDKSPGATGAADYYLGMQLTFNAIPNMQFP